MSWNVLLFVTGSVVVLLSFQWEIFRRLKKYSHRLEREQAQSSLENRLYSVLNIPRPLPGMRGWAISPDIGWIYVSHIFENQPRTIVECGSGVSTLLAGYSLKRLGGGKVIALDHDQAFAQTTARHIREHGLEDYAQVIFAPLVPHTDEGQEFLWYDLSHIKMPQIDLLLIDGPPGHLQTRSRYGALPLLKQHLHGKSLLLLDDTQRTDEQEIITRWMNQFPLERQDLKAEKGAVLLSFKPLAQPQTKHQK